MGGWFETLHGAARWPGAAGLALLLGGCQPLPHPFAADLPPPDFLALRDTAAVTVEPVAGTPRAIADKLLPAMTQALRQHDIAAGETADPSAYRLSGTIRLAAAADGQAVLSADWRLRDPKGRPVGERSAQLPAPAGDWQQGSEEAVQRLAMASAATVAALLEDKPPAEVTVAAASGPRLRIDAVTGAPGDGDEVLKKAIAALLQRQGVTLVSDRNAKTDLELDAAVAVGAPKAGKQHVAISWRVRRAGGAELGNVAQANDVPAGLLDGAWGDLAYTVALAAEPGILALIERGTAAQ